MIVLICCVFIGAELFGEPPLPKEPLCLPLQPVSLSEGFPQLGKDLNLLLSSLSEAVKTGDAQEIAKLYHPRLNIAHASVQGLLTKLSYSLKAPLEVSLYRLWSLESPEERSLLVPCADGEFSIYTHYGYSHHYALVLQILGQKELGRIFTTIVPYKETWALGSFHYQTWTRDGKPWQQLFREGKVDWAMKFLSPNPYFVYQDFEANVINVPRTFRFRERRE